MTSEIQNRHHLGAQIDKFVPDSRKRSQRSILFQKLRDERKISAKVKFVKEKSEKKKRRKMQQRKQ